MSETVRVKSYISIESRPRTLFFKSENPQLAYGRCSLREANLQNDNLLPTIPHPTTQSPNRPNWMVARSTPQFLSNSKYQMGATRQILGAHGGKANHTRVAARRPVTVSNGRSGRARSKRRGFSPGAAARHSQHARVQGRAAAEDFSRRRRAPTGSDHSYEDCSNRGSNKNSIHSREELPSR